MPQEKQAAREAALFPPIEPHASGMLELEAPHRMYFGGALCHRVSTRHTCDDENTRSDLCAPIDDA